MPTPTPNQALPAVAAADAEEVIEDFFAARRIATLLDLG